MSNSPGGRVGRLGARLAQACVVAVGVGVLLAGGRLGVLHAAGFVGTEPAGGGAIAQAIHTLQSNLDWLIGTGIGLALGLVFALVFVGSQRAPEHIFRMAGAIVGLIVVIPTILK